MKTIGMIGGVGCILLACLFFFSRKLLYFPAPLSSARSDNIRSMFDAVEEVSITAKDGVVLHGWVMKKNLLTLPTIFYFGGNAEEVSLNLEDYWGKLVANVILINYRGYGKSQGRPSETDLKSDALTIYDTMVNQLGLKPGRTIAWGRSLGSSMACFLALERDLPGLILSCPFDSIERVAGAYYPSWLVKLVLRDRHRTTDFSSRIKSKTLVLAAGRDEVIPMENTQELFESLTGKKEMVFIDKAGHNTISGFESYYNSVNRFCSEL